MDEEMNERKKDEAEKVPEVAESSTRYLIYTIIFVVLLIAIFFSIRYFYHPNPKIETYESPAGFKFTYLAGLWNTEWQKESTIYSLHFHYNPGQTENISVIGTFNDTSFNKGYAYITFDPNGGDLEYIRLATLELSLNLNRALNVEPRAACTENETGCEKVPIMNCTNTKEPVIQLSSKKPSFIGLNSNCIFLQGEKEELVRAADRLLFQWFGLM